MVVWCARVGVVLVAMMLVAACSGNAEESAAERTIPAPASTSPPSTSTSTTLAPATTTSPPTTVTEPTPETDVDVLAAFVADRSGLAFGDAVTMEQAIIRPEELDIDPALFVEERIWDLFVPLGLVGPRDDRIAAGLARLEQVRGVCCPVRLFETDDHPLMTSVVVVHELAHLIDEQRTWRLTTPPDEPLRFPQIVSEGSAQRIALEYQAELEAAGAASSIFALGWDDARIPPAVLQYLELPYDEGAAFMAALHERGGAELVDEAFRRLPVSSEQVLDVDAYLVDERPVDVEAPTLPAGTAAAGSGTIGSFVLRLLAEATLDAEAATDLVTAWAGDRYVLFEQAGRPCLRATVVMDDVDSAQAMVEALRGAGVGAVVGGDAPTELAVRRCASPAG